MTRRIDYDQAADLFAVHNLLERISDWDNSTALARIRTLFGSYICTEFQLGGHVLSDRIGLLGLASALKDKLEQMTPEERALVEAMADGKAGPRAVDD